VHKQGGCTCRNEWRNTFKLDPLNISSNPSYVICRRSIILHSLSSSCHACAGTTITIILLCIITRKRSSTLCTKLCLLCEFNSAVTFACKCNLTYSNTQGTGKFRFSHDLQIRAHKKEVSGNCSFVRDYALTAGATNIMIVWDMTSYSLVHRYQRLGRTRCL
jgi:hypothetical protein